MNLPPFCLGAALLFWGWTCNWMQAAVPLALLLESARFVPTRWEFTTQDFHRIWTFCVLIVLAAALFSVSTGRSMLDSGEVGSGGGSGVATAYAIRFFQWWPMIFAPFVLAFFFSRQRYLPLSVFSWLVRNSADLFPRPRTFPGRQVAPDAVYFGLVLGAAAMTSLKSPFFLPLLALLTGWALWASRSRSVPRWVFVLMLLGACFIGAAGVQGMRQLQAWVSRFDDLLMQRLSGGRFDPLESRTQLGAIALHKGSSRIALRLFTTNAMPPELVRSASYDTFSSPVWMLGTRGDKDREHIKWLPLSAEQDGMTWVLGKEGDSLERNFVRIAQFASGSRTLLSLPLGALVLSNLNAQKVSWTRYGAVRAEDSDQLLDFVVSYQAGSNVDREPTARDLHISQDERPHIEALAARLQLAQRRAVSFRDPLRVVRGHFLSSFKYSLRPEIPPGGNLRRTPLFHFLEISKEGHCEYFATASCLLLRAAGIHARYVTGYSVQEAAGANQYLVRHRHAHAWVIYWSPEERRWFDFDTTPPDWVRSENQQAAVWEPALDVFSRLWFEFSLWRAGRSELARGLTMALMVILAGFLVRLFIKARRQKRSVLPGDLGWQRRMLGLDSEYYRIESSFAKQGLGRRVEETAFSWAKRIQARLTADQQKSLHEIQELHYRLRFDPAGVSEVQRKELAERVQRWMSLPAR